MENGLFQSWLEIEKASGKPMTQILSEINEACGTAYRHNWPSKMADNDYSLERVSVAVRRYMLRKVLPAELSARGVSFPSNVIESLICRLTEYLCSTIFTPVDYANIEQGKKVATKTTGVEFKRFYEDKCVWPEGAYHDGVVILVDSDDASDTDLSLVPDAANVVIESGWVFVPNQDDAISLETYFKRWRKSQSLRSLVVEVDVAKLDAVIAAIKTAGGKIRQ